MKQKVLDVGNCVPDHNAIKNLVQSQFDATVDRAHGLEDAIAAMRGDQYALVLINRKLDRDDSDGLDIVRQLKASDDLAEIPVMLITNFPEHQELAVTAGAEPGFGKNELGSPETKARLARFLEI